MPFSPIKFMGATVRNFSSQIGWGTESSQFVVNLVQDPRDGDMFSPGPEGTPAYFDLGPYYFRGIVQKTEQTNSTDGYPVFAVTMTDPRNLLENVHVITGGYNGSTLGVANLLNVFGYWENTLGYGSSQANESGMPWYRVQAALLAMCNNPIGTSFGGPLQFRGFSYSLDLSELPVPPSYYRVGGGGSVGLLELIAQVCEDGACDFFVELDGYTIVVRTRSRLAQPPLGTIALLLQEAANTGLRAESVYGNELRNDVTSTFLVGSEQTALNLTDTLDSFWGYDVAGNPILGYPDVVPRLGDFVGTSNAVPPSVGQFIYADLNASPVADILGSLTYSCSTLEMRAALGNMDTWALFVGKFRPAVASVLGIVTTFNDMIGGVLQGQQIQRNDIVNDVTLQAVLDDSAIKRQRVYEFVRSYATDWMGRKYVVAIPFVLAKQDPDTLVVTYSQEPTEAGYLPEGSQPLGLSPLNQDIFMNQDGRFTAFVEFAPEATDDIILGTVAASLDLTNLNHADVVFSGGSIYMKAQVSTQIIFTPSPAVVVTLSAPVYEQALDVAGGYALVNALFQYADGTMQDLATRGHIPLRFQPPARDPSFAAIPLKSNILTYGPWFAQGAAGKVRFEQDTTLNPWTYGGFDNMNLAGDARVLTAITNMQVGEQGTVTLAELPRTSLGNVLQVGGPEVTNIDISYGANGAKTTYQFRTFTAPFRAGVFSKTHAERMRRIAATNLQLRRSLRQSLRRDVQNQVTTNNALTTFLANAPKSIKRESPHDTLVAHSIRNSDGTVRVDVSTVTYEEAVGLVNKKAYNQTGLVSLNALLRPYSTLLDPSGTCMAGMGNPSVVGSPSDWSLTINAFSYSQLKIQELGVASGSHDIEVVANGTTYDGLAVYRKPDQSDLVPFRSLALKGPLTVAGWGFDIQGNPVPSGTGPGGFLTNWMKKEDTHKVGPVDLLWDEYRGVWTCHGKVRAKTNAIVPHGMANSVTATVYDRGGNVVASDFPVWNAMSTDVGNGVMVFCDYFPLENRWYVTAADCT